MLMAMQDELLGRTVGQNYEKSLETQVMTVRLFIYEVYIFYEVYI
jgi:hypothetical protein